MPSLKDQIFGKSVIYIHENNQDGAMGMIINKPLQINLGGILEHLAIPSELETVNDLPVLMGGPVGQEHGFVLHPAPHSKQKRLRISPSKELLKQIATGQGPSPFTVVLGYAGWEPQQLEREIQRNDWLVAPFDESIVFDTPLEQRWYRAAQLLGVDPTTLSSLTGHA